MNDLFSTLFDAEEAKFRSACDECLEFAFVNQLLEARGVHPLLVVPAVTHADARVANRGPSEHGCPARTVSPDGVDGQFRPLFSPGTG